MLQDFVEVSDNQFDQGTSIVGLGNKKKPNRFQREGQRLPDRIEKEKDEDIKRELKKEILSK
jgi:hypothetical protein